MTYDAASARALLTRTPAVLGALLRGVPAHGCTRPSGPAPGARARWPAREANLGELDRIDLDEAALATTGLHHVLGDVRLSHLLSAWVVHDLNHLAQMTRALASRYREAVGPWVEFLPILRPRSADESGSSTGR